jgi:hypothetical protein
VSEAKMLEALKVLVNEIGGKYRVESNHAAAAAAAAKYPLNLRRLMNRLQLPTVEDKKKMVDITKHKQLKPQGLFYPSLGTGTSPSRKRDHSISAHPISSSSHESLHIKIPNDAAAAATTTNSYSSSPIMKNVEFSISNNSAVSFRHTHNGSSPLKEKEMYVSPPTKSSGDLNTSAFRYIITINNFIIIVFIIIIIIVIIYLYFQNTIQKNNFIII